MYRARGVQERQDELEKEMKDIFKEINAIEKIFNEYGITINERKQILKNAKANAANRKSELLLKLFEAIKFVKILDDEPELIMREIQNIKNSISILNQLTEYTNRVKNGDVKKETLRKLNELQDEVKTYAETNIDKLKLTIKKLTKTYQTQTHFANTYKKNNRLTESDLLEIKAIVELSKEYITDPEYKRMKKEQEKRYVTLIRLKLKYEKLTKEYEEYGIKKRKYSEAEGKRAYSEFKIF